MTYRQGAAAVCGGSGGCLGAPRTGEPQATQAGRGGGSRPDDDCRIGAAGGTCGLDLGPAGRVSGRDGRGGQHLDRNGAGYVKKNALKPWRSRSWCIPPRKNADFVVAMGDVLDVYHRDFDDDTVLVCVDEVSKQRTKAVRTAVPMEPGQPARIDCEYERNGTANLFMVCAPLLGWRHVKVTERRTTADFAALLAALANVHFPNQKIVLVMDNRNTHKLSSLYHVYPPKEARRLSRRFEVHHTPKHGSGLNIAESEISVLSRQCLSRRLADRETLTREVAAWPAAINADPRPVKWRFTAAEARIKLHSLYPAIQ